MDGAVLLNVAAVFDDNLSPITPDGGSGRNIHIPADGHIAGHHRLRVNEGTFVDNRFVALKFVDHVIRVFVICIIVVKNYWNSEDLNSK